MPPPDQYRGLPKAITGILSSESDRGVALVIASYLEEILSFLITSACVSDGLAKKLLKTGRPAGSFDAKILLSQALGLIHDDEVHALRVVQRVRNRAAHFRRTWTSPDEMGFELSAFSEQILPFARKLSARSTDVDSGEIRETFIAASRLLAMRLLASAANIQRPESPRSFRERADQAQQQLEGTPLGELLAEARRQAKLGNLEPLQHLMGVLRSQHDQE